jgi:hypothetical protein
VGGRPPPTVVQGGCGAHYEQPQLDGAAVDGPQHSAFSTGSQHDACTSVEQQLDSAEGAAGPGSSDKILRVASMRPAVWVFF